MSKFTDFIKSNKNDIFKPVAVLLAICIVIPLALSLTNKLTVNRIAKLQDENEKKTMSQLIDAESFEKATLSMADAADSFEYYIAQSGSDIMGYIFVTSAKGYGGTVSVMTAVEPSGNVKAVAILDASNETPGLGQNVTKEKFYSQFAGKTDGIKILKNGANDSNNEINAVTGATISSTAVTKAVNTALDNYKAVMADTLETEVTGNDE